VFFNFKEYNENLQLEKEYQEKLKFNETLKKAIEKQKEDNYYYSKMLDYLKIIEKLAPEKNNTNFISAN